MSDFMDKQKDEFDDFVSKWEKAQQDGIFANPEVPDVNPQTATGSFFGFTHTNPTDSANQTDTQYWNAINMAADDHDPKVISESEDNSKNVKEYKYKCKCKCFSCAKFKNCKNCSCKNCSCQGCSCEDAHSKYKKIINKNEKLKEADEHKSVPSNPVARDTMGPDQDMSKQSLGASYTEEDFLKLEELKKQLFGLENKLATSMGFGDEKNQKKIQTQIESIKKEINGISDEMGRTYKNVNQPKHLENL